MPQPLTLATLAVLATAGAMSGVYLGRSAVAEINPVFYDEPETRFHADLVPDPPGFDAPPVRQAGYPTGDGLGSGCVGCLTYPEEYYPVHDSSVDKYQPGYAEMAEAPAAVPAVYAPESVEDERSADFAAVERYASYPVVVEEAVAEAAVEAEPAVEVELASADGTEPTD